jgi:periplasmic protein TonB
MFNNLVESSSHAKEFKRRGSFLLFTTATYLVLFVVTGVVSIYAYDAHLESQNTELEITFVPLRDAEPEPQPQPEKHIATTTPEGRQATESARTALITSASDPTKVPDEIGTKAPNVPPATKYSVLRNYNAEPETPAGNRVGTGTGNTPVVNMTEPPPPALEPKKQDIPKVVNQSTGVIKGNAISLPKPIYSEIARKIKVQGEVTVQILIDENGNVVSAKAVSGHPLLIPEVLKAARQARFKPTLLSGQPVKVSGLITYSFTLGQ